MIHDWNSVVEKHAQTMLQLLYLVHVGKPGELEQIVNIPVSQIVEEIVNIPVSDCGESHRLWKRYSSSTDCGRDRRGEQILDCVEEYPEPLL